MPKLSSHRHGSRPVRRVRPICTPWSVHIDWRRRSGRDWQGWREMNANTSHPIIGTSLALARAAAVADVSIHSAIAPLSTSQSV